MPDEPSDSARAASPADAWVPDRRTAGTVMLAAALLVAAQLVALVASGTSPGLLTLDVAAGVLSLALLPVLLRRPAPGALLLTALAVFSPAATPGASIAAFHVAQRTRLRVAVGVAAAGIAAQVLRGWWRPVHGLPFGWWVLLVTVAYATLVGWGRYAQARRQLLESLRERARRAEAEQAGRVAEARMAERSRIAREMHDVLAHRLSLVATYAGALEYRPDASPEQLSAAAGVVRAGVHQALDELRDVITLLRDEDGPGGLGSAQPPQPTLADLPRLLEETRAVGTAVRVEADGDLDALPAAVGRTAYRVVQESLTNARRHAPGCPVTVDLRGSVGDRLEIGISNPLADHEVDGAGGAGTGLVGLAERVQLAGGALTWSRSDTDFRLRASLPWRS